MGSPQQYWIHSAFQLGLVDSKKGIQFDPTSDGDDEDQDVAAPTEQQISSPRYSHTTSDNQDSYPSPNGMTSPTHSSSSAESHASSPGMSAILEAAELQARQQDGGDQTNPLLGARSIPEMTHGDDDAIMLLSLRNTVPSPSTEPARSPQYRPSGV